MVSKLNSDRKAGESAMRAIGRIYGVIGAKGLFNGLGVRIVMIGTLTGAQWFLYDVFKVSLGVSDPKQATVREKADNRLNSFRPLAVTDWVGSTYREPLVSEICG